MPRKLTTGADFGSQRAQNAANATAPTDLVTLQQLQALLAGLDWKLHVRAVATANVTVSNPGTATFDGVALNNGDRLLLVGQTTASQNNVYIFNGASAALTLAPDAVQGELDSMDTVAVSEGTTGAGLVYTLSTKNPITVGTTALTWAQTVKAVVYSALAGGGLLLNASNQFSVDTTKVVQKYATTIGDGATLAYQITHGLTTTATGDVMIQAYLISTGEQIEADVSARTATGFTLTFGTAPAANAVRVIVQG